MLDWFDLRWAAPLVLLILFVAGVASCLGMGN